MSRFDTIDLSRVPVPDAIRGLEYEGIVSERIADLLARFEVAGIPFNVEGLETDPAVILQQVDAYRELLQYAAINDAVRAVLLPSSWGTNLDALGAMFGVARAVVAPGNPNAVPPVPPVMESDDRYRARIQLAPEAFSSAGAHGAYVFHALTADPRVLNVDVWTPAPGEVVVAVQSREGDGTAPSDLVAVVRDRLYRPDVKPLTDMVTVRSVVNIPYAISAEVFVLPGPDPVMVRTEVLASLQAATAQRRTPSRDVPRSALYAAAHIGPVDKVILNSPTIDIARGNGEVGICTGIDVKVTTYAG